MLKAILFNLDGIVTDLSNFHFLAWKSIFSHYGINFDMKQWKLFRDHSRKHIILNTFKYNRIPFDPTVADCIDREKNLLYQSLITNELKPRDVNPNILNLITQAKLKDLKICLVSHSSNTELIVERLGLSKAFDYIGYPEKDLDDTKTRLIGDSSVADAIVSFLKKSNFGGNECIGLENTAEGIEEYNVFNIFSVVVDNFDPEVNKRAKMAYHSLIDVNLDEIIFKYYTLNPNE